MDFSRVYHMGVWITDMEAHMEKYARDFGVTFAQPRTFNPLPFWTPERGLEEIELTATFSHQGPVHVELLESTVDFFYHPQYGRDGRHLGVWVDDLVAGVEDLVRQDWKVVMASGAPEDGYGFYVYLTPPYEGLMMELVDYNVAKPLMDEWLAE